MWRMPRPSRARAQAARSAGRSKNEPSAMAASIRGRSWRTGRPAPRFRWPTSELPIWPAGRPTASSEARRTACGQRSSRPRQVGIGAAAIASAAGSSRDRSRPGRRGRWARSGSGSRLRHAAAPRAAAVRPARATIPAISSGLSEAPPTSAPSMAGSARNSAMLAEVTLPPYRIGQVVGGSRPALADDAPDGLGHVRGILAAGVPAGPDGPDGLVGDDQAGRRQRGRIVPGEGAGQLPTDDVDLAPGLALRELLADAQDRAQARLDGPAELAADQLVGLGRVAPPLGVTDDDPVGEPGQHRRRDLAGVGALQLVMDVLGADADVRVDSASASRTAARQTNGGQITRITPVAAGPRRDRPGEVAGIGRGRVHLPIGGHDHVTHRRESCQSDWARRAAAVRSRGSPAAPSVRARAGPRTDGSRGARPARPGWPRASRVAPSATSRTTYGWVVSARPLRACRSHRADARRR